MRSNFKFKNTLGVEYEVKNRKPNKNTWGEDCDGTCEDPTLLNPKILINPHRGNKTKLNTAIHEFTHAFFWEASEKQVTQFANTLTKFLYKEGRRKKQ